MHEGKATMDKVTTENQIFRKNIEELCSLVAGWDELK